MRAERRLLLLLGLCALYGHVFPSTAAAERFAIAIGNNDGDAREQTLRWAEDDAARTRSLLTELGDVAEENASLVLGGTADDVRAALARLRARIAQTKHPGDTVLFAYYSGHGSARDLHLAGSRLPLQELDRLLKDTHATTLVTIVDACRDDLPIGVRDKGASHTEPFDIRLGHEAGPSGRVTITSAGRNEVAQESDNLRGSFFTHHLLSAMRGAADRDGDRQVSLDELYRYAYHHTLVSSHAHLAAVQHPQLDVDLKGEGDLVVTRLARADALLSLPAALGGDFLIVDGDSGQVVAQAFKPEGVEGRIALPAGRFLVQLRKAGAIYAGQVGLEWGGSVALDPSSLTRHALTPSVNKGAPIEPLRSVLFVGGRVGMPAVPDASALVGAGVRFGLELAGLRIGLDSAFGLSDARNRFQARDYFETRLGLVFGPRLSWAPLSLWAGVGAGAVWVHQRSTRVIMDQAVKNLGLATSSHANAVGPYLAPQLAFELALGRDYLLSLSSELQATLITVDDEMELRLLPGGSLAFGKRF